MESEAAYSDFISCDRSGRRNAIHDLQGDAAALKVEKLASTMGDIAITEEGELFYHTNNKVTSSRLQAMMTLFRVFYVKSTQK